MILKSYLVNKIGCNSYWVSKLQIHYINSSSVDNQLKLRNGTVERKPKHLSKGSSDNMVKARSRIDKTKFNLFYDHIRFERTFPIT